MVFEKKKCVVERVHRCPSQVMTALERRTFEYIHENAKKCCSQTLEAKKRFLKWQKCVFGHFLTSDVIHIFFLCRILKSTYGTNETFFSRTHSFGCGRQVWVGGWLIKVLKMVMIMLRMERMVWYTDGPWWVVSRTASSAVCEFGHRTALSRAFFSVLGW